MKKRQRSVIIPTATTIRELYKDRPIFSDDGPIWEPDGIEQVCYEVSLDLAAVEEMARRAADNAGQVANAGPLRVRVLSRARPAPDGDKFIGAA
jgi:hypothetical protein